MNATAGMKVRYASAPTNRSFQLTAGTAARAGSSEAFSSGTASCPAGARSGEKTLPSRTGRPHNGQNSEISGIEAPQYPHVMGISLLDEAARAVFLPAVFADPVDL